MPRPTNKTDLQTLMQKEHAALEKQIEVLTDEQKECVSMSIESWAFKDVLAHVTAWEQMVLGWYHAGLRGEVPPMPAKGFNWRQIPELNGKIYEVHRERPYPEIKADFDASYLEIKETIESIDNDVMFKPEQFAWTNKNNMGTYFVSATSSHYTWARKEIRKLLKMEVVA